MKPFLMCETLSAFATLKGRCGPLAIGRFSGGMGGRI